MLHSSEKVRRGSVAGMEHVRVTRRALLRVALLTLLPSLLPPASQAKRSPTEPPWLLRNLFPPC